MDTQQAKKVYGRFAGIYDAIFAHFFRPRIKEVLNSLQLNDQHKVLEVGFGTGISAPFYPPGCDVIGIDISKEMLQQAKKKALPDAKAKITIMEMDAAQLAFSENSFDHIFAPFVITVVDKPEVVFSEMLRVVKPNGKIVFINHFQSEIRWIAALEESLNPICHHLGWRMDISVSDLRARAPEAFERSYRIQPYDPWKVVVFRKKTLSEQKNKEI